MFVSVATNFNSRARYILPRFGKNRVLSSQIFLAANEYSNDSGNFFSTYPLSWLQTRIPRDVAK